MSELSPTELTFRTSPPWRHAPTLPDGHEILAELPAVCWGWEGDLYYWIIRDPSGRVYVGATSYYRFREAKPSELTRQIDTLNSYIEATRRALFMFDSALARWGNHPGSPDSSLQPIPVSERPKPEDCNDDGYVWAWRRFDLESGIDNGDFWRLTFREWLEHEDCSFTHWLPAHALPLPTHE